MQTAIQELIKKRQSLRAEKDRIVEKYDKEMSDIDNAIETLSGKTVWETLAEERFDDVNPNYIKGSYEEL